MRHTDLREKLIDRIDILNKVKELFLIPKLEMMSLQMVADFYEVTTTVINTLYIRHKQEIDADGVTKKSLYQIKEACFAQDVQGNLEAKIVSGKRGHTTIVLGTKEIVFPNSGGKFFSPRAVLRIGMLLRDSEVAKEVRTQLLNTFEAASSEQKTAIHPQIKAAKRIYQIYMA